VAGSAAEEDEKAEGEDAEPVIERERHGLEKGLHRGSIDEEGLQDEESEGGKKNRPTPDSSLLSNILHGGRGQCEQVVAGFVGPRSCGGRSRVAQFVLCGRQLVGDSPFSYVRFLIYGF
jgi:hypothetical protein